MKKFCLIILALAGILFSCTKNAATTNESYSALSVIQTQKIPEVTDTLMEMLIKNVKSMKPVMKWFVYGCDVIGFEEDIQYLTDNGTYYFRINDPEFSEAGIKSLESLRNYLRQFFTTEYTESIMEKYSQKFLEADGELYILAASAAPSALYTVESASAVYICDNEIKLTFDAAYKLFNAEPQPTALEFTFILEDGKWLCSSSPDFFSCVKIYLDE